jgi:hypothetical protein
MYVLLNGWTDIIYIPYFLVLSLRGVCPVNMNIPAPKAETLQMDPENCDFFEGGNSDFN